MNLLKAASGENDVDKDSVDDVLGGDHAALGTMLEELRAAGEVEAFRRFEARLRKHMAWEEEALFPAVRAHATAVEARSIESLEIDHERIRETMDGIAAALGAGDAEAAARGLAQLEIYLRGHNYDEEHGVYVEADRYLGAEERRRLLERFAGA